MIPATPRILSVATAVPPYRMEQTEVKEFARSVFGGTHRDLERLLPIFDNAMIEDRYFCVPPQWFEEEHTFPEKNDLYVENALELSEKAAHRAMDRAGYSPEDVGAVFFVSTTGLSTPSLDSKLIFRLGLPEHVRRVPVWGLGCAGGVGGLALAADYARLYPEKPVLLVGVELCGLTFQRGDLSKANLVSASLFGDGAAAVLVGAGEGLGIELLGSYSTTWPGTEDVMGWDLVDGGLKVRISRSIPSIVLQKIPQNLREACSSAGLTPGDLRHYVLHPGGARVLEAFEQALGLGPGELVFPREVLRDYGNMSSVTVMFVLERFLENGGLEDGGYGVFSALGPGFSAEHVFFRC